MKPLCYRRNRVTGIWLTILLFIMLVPGYNVGITQLRAAPVFLPPGQSYTTPDGAYTLNYPDGWMAKALGNGTLIFATDQQTIDQVQNVALPTLRSGQAAIQVQYFTEGKSLPSGVNANSNANALLSSLLKSGVPFKAGDIQPVTIGTLDVASAAISSQGFAGIVYTFFEGNTPFITAVIAAPGELAADQPITEALIQSIRPTNPPATMQATGSVNASGIDLSQSGVTPDKNFSFSYPASWISQSIGNMGVLIGTSQSAIAANKLKSGEIAMEIEDFPKSSSIPPGAKLDAGPVALLKSLISSSTTTSNTYSDVKSYKLGQIDAARVDVTGDGIAGVGYAFWVGDMPFVVLGATAPGETDANILLFEAIAQSIKPASQSSTPTQLATQSASNGTTIDLSQKFTFPDFVMQLNYPAGWVTKKVSGYVILANSDAALSATTSSNPQLSPGSIAIIIKENLLGAVNLTNDDLTAQLKALMPNVPSIQVNPPVSYQIGGTLDAIRITARGSQLDAVGYAFKLDKSSAFIAVAGTTHGELDADIPTVEAILTSIGTVH